MGCPCDPEERMAPFMSAPRDQLSHMLLYPNGYLRWRFDNRVSNPKDSASIAGDGTIYIPFIQQLFLCPLPKWNVKMERIHWRQRRSRDWRRPFPSDGTFYVGTEQLRAFYPNGTLKWSSDVEGTSTGPFLRSPRMARFM